MHIWIPRRFCFNVGIDAVGGVGPESFQVTLCCGSRRGFGKSDLGQQFPWGNALPVSQSSLLSQQQSSASGPEQVLNKHLLNEGTNRTSNTSRHLYPGHWLTWRMVSGPILPQHIRAVSSKPLPTPVYPTLTFKPVPHPRPFYSPIIFETSQTPFKVNDLLWLELSLTWEHTISL